MNSRETLIRERIGNISSIDPEICIQLSEQARSNGDIEKTKFWILKGFELSKALNDRPRIQQFSNMLVGLL